jgi:hypothetical protein
VSNTINIVPGSVVLLVDGHGCHRLHLVDEWDVVTADAFRLGGDVWQSLTFNADADATVAYGLPVLRSAQPAIGRPSSMYCRLFLPAGWRSPRKPWPSSVAGVPVATRRIGITDATRRARRAVS